MKSIVPEAVCCRSHSITTSSIIVNMYDEVGIKYELNTFIRPFEGMNIYSYKAQIGKTIIIPFIFEDDMWLEDSKENGKKVEYLLSDKFIAPRVLNFHPSQLFLNTYSFNQYSSAKEYYKDFERFREFVNDKEYGVRDMFKDLIRYAREQGYNFKKISEGDWN
ncbi:MAG: hypothetical protein IJT96_09145 [Lachnospiraceae bacterium]|nr:hypothetical protein [Lachnospiraceae bacterium]